MAMVRGGKDRSPEKCTTSASVIYSRTESTYLLCCLPIRVLLILYVQLANGRDLGFKPQDHLQVVGLPHLYAIDHGFRQGKRKHAVDRVLSSSVSPHS